MLEPATVRVSRSPRSAVGAVAQEKGELRLQLEHHLHHPLDEVWRILTASCHREHWIPCGILDELRDATTVQPPFWPVNLSPTPGVLMFTGVTRVWRAPTVFEWTGDTDMVRWQLCTSRGGTKVELIARIAHDDPAGAANVAADHHIGFRQFVRLVELGSVASPTCVDYLTLAREYLSKFAGVLDEE